MPSDTYAERILIFVSAKEYQPQQIQELARTLGIDEAERGNFHEACKTLARAGRLVMSAGNAVMLPNIKNKIVGIFRGNPRGFGFVIPDTPSAQGDLYVPAGATGGAITGDTVIARVKKRGKRDGKMLHEGQIVEIVKRGHDSFVGELRHRFRGWFVVPDGNALHVPIVVDDPGAKGARAGDQVVVEITEYPNGTSTTRGVIIQVLGRRGDPGIDTLSIIAQHHLPESFAAPVLRAARRAVESYDPAEEIKTREDLSKYTIITIDPDDARDFDDAISLTANDDGTVELGVHIADVAHFVREGSPLDREARERANSVYLADIVIPMLPEVLSNGVCSLQERQPRLAKSAFITYDKRGRVKRTRFANTIIRSSKRLTYRQAAAILDGKSGRISAKTVALLKAMEKLAQAIRRRRIRDGMLVLDLPNVELVFDEERRVVDVVPEDTSFPHTIIEMFMVEANEAVARLFVDINTPHLRRIHDEPDARSGTNLRKFLRVLGHDAPDGIDRFALQSLLGKVRGKSDAFAVNLAVLRSMQQAVYSPRHVGHYALGSKHYCHFTSPIRRYPDLAIHRLIDRYLRGRLKSPTDKRKVSSNEKLSELGEHCSRIERRAESAERELKLVLILRLLESHIGDSFEGVVSGVANMGVFVQLERYLVEGLLRFDALGDDWWEVDSSRSSVMGERTGQRITIGDRLKVLVSRVDLSNRQIELELGGKLLRRAKAPTRRSRQPVKAVRTERDRSGSVKRRGRSDAGTRGRKRR